MKLKDILLETSKYSKFKKHLYGLRNSNKGMAILTAENPNGVQLSKSDNIDEMKKLKDYLIKNKLGYFDVKGFYGQKENSIIITDITETETRKLGKDFKQDSIIYIVKGSVSTEKFTNQLKIKNNENLIKKYGNEMPIFEMIKINPLSKWLDDDKLVRKIFDVPQNAVDEYTIINGNKFQIPFFDDDFQKTAEETIEHPINKTMTKTA